MSRLRSPDFIDRAVLDDGEEAITMRHIRRGADETLSLRDSEFEPEQALGVAVLSKAIADAKRNRPGARLWFRQINHGLLDFWCEVLRVDPKVVQARVLSMPEKPIDRARAPRRKGAPKQRSFSAAD